MHLGPVVQKDLVFCSLSVPFLVAARLKDYFMGKRVKERRMPKVQTSSAARLKQNKRKQPFGPKRRRGELAAPRQQASKQAGLQRPATSPAGRLGLGEAASGHGRFHACVRSRPQLPGRRPRSETKLAPSSPELLPHLA